MNVHYAKFQKSLIVEQFQGNYLKSTVLLRPTERFLALKCTVLLSNSTAEKHYFAGPKLPQCLKINSTKKCSRVELTNEQQQHATVLLVR